MNFREQTLVSMSDIIEFESDVVVHVAQAARYHYDVDCREQFHVWNGHKLDDVATYRDHPAKSKYTGTVSPVHHTPCMDESHGLLHGMFPECRLQKYMI